MKYFLIILLNILSSVLSYKICIAGGSSGLGRELIQQSIERKDQVIALSNKKEIYYPYRGEGLKEGINSEIFNHELLKINNYYDKLPKYNSLVLTMGGTAFEKDDYSDKVTQHLLKNLPNTCNKIVLISAYGVGDSINEANLGIVSMRNWYLKDVYRAKEEQEKLVSNLNNKIDTKIYRPKVLSYGGYKFNATPRQELANDILTFLHTTF